jgi:hypothetical protein
MRVQGPSREHLDAEGEAFEALVMRGIEQALRVTAKDLKATWTGDDLGVIARVFDRFTETDLLPWLATSYLNASLSQRERLLDEVVTAASMPIPPPASGLAEQYLATATNRLKGISDVVWDDARKELLTGMERGESIPQLRKRVMGAAGVARPRATMIARTEVIGAQNRGSLDQMIAAGFPGKKTWLATRDHRTRPSHANANMQERAIVQPGDTEFMVGGVSMDGPHDPSAPPRETINCRCTLLYALDDQAVTEAAEDGAWEQLDEGTLFNRTVPPEMRGYKDTAVRSLIQQELVNTSVYARGEHLIKIVDEGALDGTKVKRLFTVVDDLLTAAPPGGGDPLRLTVGTTEARALATTVIGQHDIIMDRKVLMPDKQIGPEYFSVQEGSTHWMPVSHQVSLIDYVVAHEWGHAIAERVPEKIGQRRDMAYFQRRHLSGYGNKEYDEAYAEAFAEWFLTRGQTTNEAAQAYAREFGWRLAS